MDLVKTASSRAPREAAWKVMTDVENAPFITGRTRRYLAMEIEGWARRSEAMEGTLDA